MRMTIPLQLVVEFLLEDPERELYGLEIGGAAGLASGTVHPLLARLEGHGWLESRWEDIDPKADRPAGTTGSPGRVSKMLRPCSRGFACAGRRAWRWR